MAPAPAISSRLAARARSLSRGVDLGVDVAPGGGGKARFDQIMPVGQPNAGQTVLQTAVAQGYTFVGDRASLLATHTSKKVARASSPAAT